MFRVQRAEYLFGGGYCISKYGVEAFPDSLRRELSPFGVRVIVIIPGNFKTSICPDNIQDVLNGIWNQVSPDVKESYGDQYFESFCQNFRKMMSRAQKDLTQVTDCMEQALIATYSRTHYVVGWDAKYSNYKED